MFSLRDFSHNLIINGPFGSGKTSLLAGTLKEINFKKKNLLILTIDQLENEKGFKSKEKISNFTGTKFSSFCGSKVIILEEIDSISSNNQMSLRDIYEKNPLEGKFYATCNSLSKVNLAVFSRCLLISLNLPPPLFLAVRLKEISEKENFVHHLEDFKVFLNLGMGFVRNTVDFLSIFPIEKKQGEFLPIFFSPRKSFDKLKNSKEILTRDFQFIAFKKNKKNLQKKKLPFF